MKTIESSLKNMEITSRYLKELIRLQKTHQSKKIPTKFFCEKFQVHPSTVTEHFQKLEELEIVEYTKYKGIQLTPFGTRVGLILMRNHRVLEFFFNSILGLTQQDACEEADRIDLFISKRIIDKLCTFCEHPSTCPCGHEIYHQKSE